MLKSQGKRNRVEEERGDVRRRRNGMRKGWARKGKPTSFDDYHNGISGMGDSESDVMNSNRVTPEGCFGEKTASSSSSLSLRWWEQCVTVCFFR